MICCKSMKGDEDPHHTNLSVAIACERMIGPAMFGVLFFLPSASRLYLPVGCKEGSSSTRALANQTAEGGEDQPRAWVITGWIRVFVVTVVLKFVISKLWHEVKRCHGCPAQASNRPVSFFALGDVDISA